jgi:hypothetical protein
MPYSILCFLVTSSSSSGFNFVQEIMEEGQEVTREAVEAVVETAEDVSQSPALALLNPRLRGRPFRDLREHLRARPAPLQPILA